MLTCSKFILGLFCAKVIFRRGVSIEIKKCLRWITRVYIIVIFSLSVHDWFMKPIFKVLYDSVSSGFSTKALCLFYSNATYLAAYAIIALIILIYTKEKNDRLFYVYVGLCFFVIFTTTRSKSWSFLCITILIYMLTLDVSKKKSLKQRLLIIIPAGCLAAVLVAWNKIILYFFTPSHYSPRSILLQGGIAIAKECFPLGSGFGTYCSLAAVLTNKGIDVLRYSTAYYDNFWACMIGQFGFIGTVLYIAMIICVIADIMFLFQNENKNLWYVAIFAILYLLIASLGESSFFSQYSLGYGFVIGLSLSSGLDRMT